MKKAAFALSLLLGVLGQTGAVADQLSLATAEPLNPVPLVATPTRFATMNDVKQRFGKPSQILPAVGKPPITRWIYPQFIVYFEGRWVIHSVKTAARFSGKIPQQNSARKH